jgi:hypothetical protein
MGSCSPGARAVAVPSTFNVGSGFGFGGAAAQGNSSVKGNYLVSNMVSKLVIAFARLGSLSPPRCGLVYPTPLGGWWLPQSARQPVFGQHPGGSHRSTPCPALPNPSGAAPLPRLPPVSHCRTFAIKPRRSSVELSSSTLAGCGATSTVRAKRRVETEKGRLRRVGNQTEKAGFCCQSIAPSYTGALARASLCDAGQHIRFPTKRASETTAPLHTTRPSWELRPPELPAHAHPTKA